MNPAKNLKAKNAAEGGFPIVSIGASAGGLAAFEECFSGMPAEAQQTTKQGAVVQVSIFSTALVSEAGQMYAIATTKQVLATNDSNLSGAFDKPAPGEKE